MTARKLRIANHPRSSHKNTVKAIQATPHHSDNSTSPAVQQRKKEEKDKREQLPPDTSGMTDQNLVKFNLKDADALAKLESMKAQILANQEAERKAKEERERAEKEMRRQLESHSTPQICGELVAGLMTAQAVIVIFIT
ncbi:hypothetical protein BJ508DRAFT_335949 [Ascobolus immersus RN42]|uniref:Uncharacterized protein n=1 Tax=Ascobolus immersus RN42 TaxID=1160509 RepID=A0A3N4HGN8_ASCIM|nr:hypothetical protein BJ508DRAFT_335949 [Ascobolus immersus RN42]